MGDIKVQEQKNALILCSKCRGPKDGKSPSHCLACRRIYGRSHYLRHREKEIKRCAAYNKKNPHVSAKSMRKCRNNRPEFYKNYSKTYRENHPEIYQIADSNKRIQRNYQKNITPNPITKAEWETIKKRQKGRCFYCREKTEKLELEHMIPLSRGGLHNKENVCGSCPTCNSEKFTKTAEEFLNGKSRK